MEASECEFKKDNKPKKQWISDRSWKLIRKRPRMKTFGLTEGNLRNRYNRLTKEINGATKEDKSAYFDSICQEIEQGSFKSVPRDLFKKVKSLTKATEPPILTIKAKNAEKLTSKSVIERWKTYCQELMAGDSTDSHSYNRGVGTANSKTGSVKGCSKAH
ncbi:hypothetical protein HHI36_018053 [Cryptolaemus montrouzieri]|uniref:Uncharacterized protein n=1 Tax=Cryptolaemus montrouzieri TaxID=559131 RepID=A0ABD2NZG6_9CUCU